MDETRKSTGSNANRFAWITRLTLVGALLCLAACGGSGDSGGSDSTASRTFLMGSTPFFASFDGSQVEFPDWRFENLDDRDLLSLHVDDFLGVPWDYCDATACSNLPQSWVEGWQQLVNGAKATGKPVYLAVSPLGDRRTLAPNLLPDGGTRSGWNANVDANGCYLFASDSHADSYKAAYISYLKYLIALVAPDYLSPAIEMNMPFTTCPLQKTAWIAWYNDVHAAIKKAYPELVVFPTFQLEYMYGIAEASSACGSGTLAACFDARLGEALTIPADRIAFSTYPAAWAYHAEFEHGFPRDTFAKVELATTRKIWVSETGWPSVPLLSSYSHDTTGSCGAVLYPATLDIPGVGSIDLADDQAQADYLAWLMEAAQTYHLEAVIWWLNRDYLDEAVTGKESCPCVPTGDSTCLLLDQFYGIGGNSAEVLLRLFGNMALRHFDGSPRPGQAIWRGYLNRRYQP